MNAKRQAFPAAQPVSASSMLYRPWSYFRVGDEEVRLLASVKGTVRRRAALQMLEAGREVPPELAVSSLDDEDRRITGSWHPSYMGGEYLDDHRPGEVEIARISIRSTTGDVTCVYARELAGRTGYRVVDEYEGETLSERSKRTSVRPLTMGELVSFFLGAWDLYACLDANFEGELDGMLRFFRAESSFYPAFDATLRDLVRRKFGAPS
jgi:hypothetical protein